MSKRAKNSEKKQVLMSESEVHIFTCNSIEYLTFPETMKFTGINRSTLHQQIVRGKVEGYLSLDRYGFIPMDYCRKLRQESVKRNIIETIEKMDEKNIPFDELYKILSGTKLSQVKE